MKPEEKNRVFPSGFQGNHRFCSGIESKRSRNGLLIMTGVLGLFVLFAAPAGAQFEDVEEVLTLGTRVEGKTLSETAVPVEVISEEEIHATGHTEVGRIIQTLVSSFNFPSSSISDGTDSLRPATLRGLGPDQVLVLVNGKRRHGNALIHINSSVGRGTSGYDINSIPVAAIARIEVLRDGASAQYGSDAVAGVINIILKDGTDEGRVLTSYGQTYEGDGDTYVASVSKGAYIANIPVFASFEFRKRDRTNRAGKSGAVQYPDTEYQLVDGDIVLTDNPVNDAEKSFDRNNFRVGDAEAEQYSGSINFTAPLDDIWRDSELSIWATGSNRENTSGGFYRRANQLDRNPPNSDYPDGFLPLIETSIMDWGGSAGLAHKFENSSMDLSIGGGWNKFDFRVKNSHNASYVNCARNFGILGAGTAPTETSSGSGQAACSENGIASASATAETPHSADAGGFELGMLNVNLDFKHPTDRGHFAWGFDYRSDIYKINAGEKYSYLDYDGDSNGSAGIQVFPGFRPENEVSEKRHAFGLYSDFETGVYDIVTLNPAVRIERYSDFGATLNGKLSARANPLWWLTLRGSMSSGFRAPSMQQLYFNNISTQFVTEGGVMVGRDVGTFRNDSAIAKAVGIPELKEEQSVNISGGFVVSPLPNLSLSADLYWIRVDDRIILSNQIEATGTDANPALTDFNRNNPMSQVGRAQFFMNAADTETRGVDVSASYSLGFRNGSILDLLLSGTVNETEIKSVNLPGGLSSSLFGPRERSIIESWQPKDRWTLSATYRWKIITATLSMHRYGEYTECNQDPCDKDQTQNFGAKYVNDAQLGFDFERYGVVKFGANNIFDIKPDRNKVGQSRGGTIVDHEGNVIVDSAGVFTYSRRTAPFGFNGGFYYLSYERKI